MKIFSKTKTLVLGTLIFLSTSALTPFQNDAGVVIVHPSNPMSTISAGQAKLLYTRKIKRLWPNNSPIKPVAFKGKAELQTAFYSKILGMSPEEVESYFKQRQFANSETPPTEVGSEADMINYIADNPGAIGFVSSSAAEAAKGKVKVISTF